MINATIYREEKKVKKKKTEEEEAIPVQKKEKKKKKTTEMTVMNLISDALSVFRSKTSNLFEHILI